MPNVLMLEQIELAELAQSVDDDRVAQAATVASLVAASPLTPGVTYELWLAGHNSAGGGPESNRITFMAP